MAVTAGGTPAGGRPRTIVTADPELDDLNSLIRLVLYSNELQIEGLIYASSRFHWRGDGNGTGFFLPGREYAEARTSWRWAPDERFIDDVVDAYAQVHENLVVHDPRYPSPAHLRSVVCEGNVSFEGDTSEETDGSRLIARALLDDRPGPVHLQVWAGTSTIARALMSIEEQYRGSSEWERVRKAVSEKAIITKFASQDDTYEDYIKPRWPDIRVTDVATFAWGYFARRVLTEQEMPLLSADWLRDHVTTVGPLGALYRVWGDGRKMVEDDPTDYFGLAGYTADQLRAMGYGVWADPEQAGEWISEGDTTNMLNLVVPSLRGHEHPSFGGWGGRAIRTPDTPDTWTVRGAEDALGDGSIPPEQSVVRWFADAQADFAARLRWTVSARFAEANHHPTLRVLQGTDIRVSPGDDVALSAVVDDPDGDAVRCHWWHYREAGTFPGPVPISPLDGDSTRVAIPADAQAGHTIHVIVEASDDTDEPLKAYQRVVLQVV